MGVLTPLIPSVDDASQQGVSSHCGVIVKTRGSVKSAADLQTPHDFTVVEFVGDGQSGASGDGGGCQVGRVDVGYDGLDRLFAEPGDESSGCFPGDASTLPRSSHHPRDLGEVPVIGGADRGLDRACQAILVAEADHPVAPRDGRIRRTRDHALVARAQRLRGGRGSADESVQVWIG